VQHAGACAVAAGAMRAIAIADQEIATGLLLQEEAEILGAHRRLEFLHVVCTDPVAEQRAYKVGFAGMIDGRRIIAAEGELAAGFERLAGGLGDLAHAPLDHVQHLQREGAHGTFEFAEVRHHVGGLARPDDRHRDHRRVDRSLVAGHDRLERLHHLARHRHRIDAIVRHRRVRALAADRDLEFIAGGERRSGSQCELPHRHPGPVVHAKDRVHREQLEQAIVDHLARATATLLGRLEDQVDGAVEVAMTGQVLGGGQQHGRVAIVAAGMHPAAVHAGVSKRVPLRHRQRVNVRTQADRTSAAAAFDDAHDPGLAQPPMHRNAPSGQCVGDQIRGALLLETQFGVGMYVAPQRCDRRGIGQDRCDQLRVEALHGNCCIHR